MKHTTRMCSLIAAAIATVTVTASGQSKDEAAVRAASEAWQRYIARQQVDSIVALHLPNAIVMMANSPPTMGSTGIRANWGSAVKLPNLSVHWTPQHIEMVSPTAAQEFGTYTESYDGPNGKESDAGTYVTLWKKVNGKWRVALDAPVSSQPAQGAMPAEPAPSPEPTPAPASPRSASAHPFAPPSGCSSPSRIHPSGTGVPASWPMGTRCPCSAWACGRCPPERCA